MLELDRCPKKAEDADKRGEERYGWFEVYGEIEPMVGSRAGTPPAKGAGLYEDQWSRGYRAPLSARSTKGPGAHIYLYFAADCSWRMSEVLATVKHLAPVKEE